MTRVPLKRFFCIMLALLATAQAMAKSRLTVWNRPGTARMAERGLWDDELEAFSVSQQDKTRGDLFVKAISRNYIQQQFVTVMAGGKGPDVVHVWVGSLSTLARQGFLSPLDDLLATWNLKDQIPELFWEPARVGGKTYGIPFDSYFYTLLIRRDLWVAAGLDPERPPATWDELAEAARKLTDRGQARSGFGFIPTADFYLDFVWQAGGDLLRQDADGTWAPAFQENPGVTALNFIRDLRFKDKVMQPNPLASTDELMQLFAMGQVAMMPGVANQMPELISRYGMKAEDLIIAPLPAGPTGLKASHAGGDYFIINAQTEGPARQAAWDYIQHVLSPLNQLAKWDQMKKRQIPIFPGAFSVATNLVNQPEFKLVKDALSYARVEPHVENWPRIKDYIESMVLQRAMTDPDADLPSLLEEAARVVRASLL